MQMCRDASYGWAEYSITILDCLYAIEKAIKFNFFDFDDFDYEEYEFYEVIYHGVHERRGFALNVNYGTHHVISAIQIDYANEDTLFIYLFLFIVAPIASGEWRFQLDHTGQVYRLLRSSFGQERRRRPASTGIVLQLLSKVQRDYDRATQQENLRRVALRQGRVSAPRPLLHRRQHTFRSDNGAIPNPVGANRRSHCRPLQRYNPINSASVQNAGHS